MGYTRSVGTNSIPIFQGIGKDIQLSQGGYALVSTTLPLGTIIPAGTPVLFDEAARTASILGAGTLQAAATGGATVAYKINKGHTLQIGNYLAAVVGGKAYAITAIDQSNSAYDTVTVGTTLGDIALGATVFVSTATGATSAALPASNGLLYDDIVSDPSASLSVVIRGTVYARRLPFGLNSIITSMTNFIFSTSK